MQEIADVLWYTFWGVAFVGLMIVAVNIYLLYRLYKQPQKESSDKPTSQDLGENNETL